MGRLEAGGTADWKSALQGVSSEVQPLRSEDGWEHRIKVRAWAAGKDRVFRSPESLVHFVIHFIFTPRSLAGLHKNVIGSIGSVGIK